MALTPAQLTLLERIAARHGVTQRDANADGLRRRTYRALTAQGLIGWDPTLSLITLTPEGHSALKASRE